MDVKSSGDGELDSACREAIRKTRFKPATKDGVQVSVPAEHTFTIAQ